MKANNIRNSLKNMKISKNLPQFENYPTLFAIAGEFEAGFLLAKDGEIEIVDKLKLNPREEAKEKQGFITKSRGTELGAVSHHERYLKDLSKRFARFFSQKIKDLVDTKKIEDICLIAPKYAARTLLKNMHKKDHEKVHLVIYGTHTKDSAKNILELYREELAEANRYITRKEEFVL